MALEITDILLEKLLSDILADGLTGTIKGYANEGKFDKAEYCISPTALPRRTDFLADSYSVYGEAKFSPIQYVRSRQEHFLEYNYVNEDDIMDISIATIEAIENAVKYGDGNIVHIDYLIDS